jgi:uncharacterized repeat protein (TIGR04042 family)
VPEVWFKVAWPDGKRERCYSPSTVVHQHLRPGQRYPLPDFLERARAALHAASARVEAKFGFRCTSAQDQLDRIEQTAHAFAGWPDAEVIVLSLEASEESHP